MKLNLPLHEPDSRLLARWSVHMVYSAYKFGFHTPSDASGTRLDNIVTMCHCVTAECPRSSDGRQLFACVTPPDADVIVCIDEHALCDDVVHCPNGEDEDGTVCMFHRLVRYAYVIYSLPWLNCMVYRPICCSFSLCTPVSKTIRSPPARCISEEKGRDPD